MKQPYLFPIPGIVFLFFYLLFGLDMNYFIIDQGFIFIRNHYFPWKNIKISLGDIDEVTLETPYRRSRSLRILTKEFRSKKYGAGSLRGENWKELIIDLRFIGIPVKEDS